MFDEPRTLVSKTTPAVVMNIRAGSAGTRRGGLAPSVSAR
jgi:hypothetical protein